MRRLAYIAGPYAGANEAEIERNVRRACALGRWATARGYAPVVPHAISWMGCHGARDESDPGVREAAIASGVALAETVGRAGGVLLVIIRDDLTVSAGTKAEMDAFLNAGRGIHVQGMTWAQWVADEGVVEPDTECFADGDRVTRRDTTEPVGVVEQVDPDAPESALYVRWPDGGEWLNRSDVERAP